MVEHSPQILASEEKATTSVQLLYFFYICWRTMPVLLLSLVNNSLYSYWHKLEITLFSLVNNFVHLLTNNAIYVAVTCQQSVRHLLMGGVGRAQPEHELSNVVTHDYRLFALTVTEVPPNQIVLQTLSPTKVPRVRLWTEVLPYV